MILSSMEFIQCIFKKIISSNLNDTIQRISSKQAHNPLILYLLFLFISHCNSCLNSQKFSFGISIIDPRVLKNEEVIFFFLLWNILLSRKQTYQSLLFFLFIVCVGEVVFISIPFDVMMFKFFFSFFVNDIIVKLFERNLLLWRSILISFK